MSIIQGRPEAVSYDSPEAKSEVARLFSIFNALGIITFAFRGHNLVLEIQGTMPSSGKHPSRLPMWRGVKFAYLIVATCLFPQAIGGYWVYGNLMPENGGMLLSSFQIYAMPVFDNFGVQVYKQMEKAMSAMAAHRYQSFLRMLGILCFGGTTILAKLGGADRRDCFTDHLGISLSHVGDNQETSEI
ncbi:hypothetical protein CRYUN_Cryun35bG0005700 [Craigia yunnanensis]